jgi:tetratricopeptide (TPR) repeat protein
MAVFEKGMEKAKAAYAIDDTLAEGYYFYAINLGKWALAKGVLASLFRKNELIEHAETALRNETREGEKGETVDGYGPNRTLGYMYYKLPGFAGGSTERSLKYLSEAFTKAPEIALNHVYYAEVLASGNAADKARARTILDQLLAQNPETLNPSRIPETKEEFDLARKLRADLR